MKKLMLASAVAVAFSGVANAATYDVSSNITGVQLFLGWDDLLGFAPGGYFSGLQFGGTATDVDNDGMIDSANITMTGEIGFYLMTLPVRITFDLGSGGYVAGQGTTFVSGTLQADVYSTSGWISYGTVDASITNLPFLAGQPGHVGDGPQTSAGLLLVPGTHALPGLWNGFANGAGWDSAAAVFTLFGQTEGLFLDGTITLTQVIPRLEMTAVPVPAGVWLFGSGLIGLMGVRRKQRVVG